MMGFFVQESRELQLLAGAFLLISSLAIFPFGAALLLRLVRAQNEMLFGPLAPWQETGLTIGRHFFAWATLLMALYGAGVLSVWCLARAGLIVNPWE
jgi:hypothetical protein